MAELIRTIQKDFALGEPQGFRVLIKIADNTEGEKREKESKIILHNDIKHKQEHDIFFGKIVALGRTAFDNTSFGDKPKIGDHVMICRYAGVIFKDHLGDTHRIINDEEIIYCWKQ